MMCSSDHDTYGDVMRFKTKQYVTTCLLILFVITTFTLYRYFHDLENPSKVEFVWKAILPTPLFDKSKSESRISLDQLKVKSKSDYSTTCQFPRLSLYNDANKDAFEKMEPLVCSYGDDLFYLDNGIVKLNKSVLKKSSEEMKLEKCEYLAVERVSDEFFTYTEPVVKINPPFDLIIQHDFLQIRCNLVDGDDEKNKVETHLKEEENSTDTNSRNRNEFYHDYKDLENTENFDFDQFLVQVYPIPEVVKRKSIIPGNKSTNLNVLIIGLDSMSHLSFQRILPKTYSMLRDELDFTIMNGYNIIGDGTTAALIPILTGKTEMELPEVRKNAIDGGHVDSYPMIWKRFQDNGYATLFAEDEPSINTFNLRLNGFDQQPTDHYMRPFWQALWQSTLHEISPRYCTGHTPHHHFLLGYIKDFVIKYKNMPKFGFLFMGELTHWRNDPGEYIDSDFVSFLKWLKQSGELEKSVVVVMSDHGARYGKVRKTVQGKIEERLPMMSIRYPTDFLTKHPNRLNNLKLNKDRLTTPFDIHETIADILDKSRLNAVPSNKQRGISLLQEIPFDRSCDNANIDMHWCSCLSRLKQDVENEYVKKAAHELLSFINSMTLPLRKFCRKLELKTIKTAYLMIPNEKVLKFKNAKDEDFRYANFSTKAMLDIAHYQITIETLPQNGQFEATVMVNFKDGYAKLHPDISRLDQYGDQPLCVQKRYPDLRKYCLCKNYKLDNGG